MRLAESNGERAEIVWREAEHEYNECAEYPHPAPPLPRYQIYLELLRIIEGSGVTITETELMPGNGELRSYLTRTINRDTVLASIAIDQTAPPSLRDNARRAWLVDCIGRGVDATNCNAALHITEYVQRDEWREGQERYQAFLHPRREAKYDSKKTTPTTSVLRAPTQCPADRPATALSLMPAYPTAQSQSAQAAGIFGEVDIDITIDSTGKIIGESVIHSPSPDLDGAALEAAESSRFEAAIKDCKPVGGTYRFVVDFAKQ